MSFSYDVTKFNDATAGTYAGSTVGKRYQVRMLIGDTDAGKGAERRLEDEEIDFRVVSEGSVQAAAAASAEDLLSKMARNQTGTVQHQDDRRYEWLKENARRLRERLATMCIPQVGGQSVSEKQAEEQDDDRVDPSFKRNMMDWDKTTASSFDDFSDETKP